MRTVQEGNQLITGALRTQCEGDGGESTNGVQAEKDIVMLFLLSADRRIAYSVLLVAVRRVKEWMAVVQDSRQVSCSHSLRGREETLRGVGSGIERWSGDTRSV